MTSRGTVRRAAVRMLTAALLVSGSALVTGTSAQAAEGVREVGRARYVVSDDGKPVQVEQRLTLTNLKPPTSLGSYGLTAYSLWLPDGGSKLKATSGGTGLAVSVTRASGEQFARITLPRSLRYGASVDVRVTYQIKGGTPRAKDRARVGKGYAALDVYSPGDPGLARVEVVAPRSMEIDLSLPSEYSDDDDLRTTFAVGGGSFGMWGRASLRDQSQAATSTVKVGDDSFDLVGFPGDTAWSAHITSKLPATIQALEKVSGQEWPSQQTTITEDLSGEVYGWDGSYDKGVIRVSEGLDPALLAHELSHAFANYSTLDERWLTEGLAQEMATEITAAISVPDRPHPKVSPSQREAFPLAEWPGSFGVATESEAYGYPAAWRAVHTLMEGSTPASRPQLIRALTTKATVYDAPGEVTTASSPTTWRQAYDLFEVVGGNTSTRSVMTTWVIGAKDARAIPARATARAAYAAQDELDGDWSLPLGVRTPMTTWDFPAATDAMSQVKDLAAPAVNAQRVAASTGVSASALRKAYQAADQPMEYRQVAAQLATFVGQARTYEALQSDVEDAGPLTRLGATVVPLDRDVADAKALVEDLQFTDAETSLASASDALGTARLVGTAIAGGILAVLLLLVLTAVATVRRQSRRPAVAPVQGPAWGVPAAPVAVYPGGSAPDSPVTPIAPVAPTGLVAPAAPHEIPSGQSSPPQTWQGQATSSHDLGP